MLLSAISAVDPHQLAEGDEVPLAAHHPDRFQAVQLRALRPREAQDDRHVFLLPGPVEQPGARPVHGETQRFGHLFRGNAVQRRLLLIDLEAVPRLVVLDVPVDVDHPVGLRQDLLDPARHLDLPWVVGAVHLGHQRLEHRRPRGDLRHLHVRAVSRGDRLDRRPDPLRDVVALGLPLPLRNEVHLDVGDVRPPPQEVVAHQPVEVVGRGGPDVHLIVHHFRHAGDDVADLPGRGRGLLEGRPFRHVDHHLELALVVERQHLHLHHPERDERRGTEQQDDDHREESRSASAGRCRSRPITCR